MKLNPETIADLIAFVGITLALYAVGLFLKSAEAATWI